MSDSAHHGDESASAAAASDTLVAKREEDEAEPEKSSTPSAAQHPPQRQPRKQRAVSLVGEQPSTPRGEGRGAGVGEGRPWSYHEYLLDARKAEFLDDGEKPTWRHAYALLKRQLRDSAGDDVNETVLHTPNLEENPMAVELPGSDGADGIHHVGPSQPSDRTRPPRILIVGTNRWRIALNAVLLGVLGAEVQVTTDVARAATLAAPWQRPADNPKRFDAIFYDTSDGPPVRPAGSSSVVSTTPTQASHRGTGRTTVIGGTKDNTPVRRRSRRLSLRGFNTVAGHRSAVGLATDGAEPSSPSDGDGANDATVTVPVDRRRSSATGSSSAAAAAAAAASRQEEREPGEDIDLLEMLREESTLRRDPMRRAARLMAPRLRATSDVGDFCLNVRNSDAEYQRQTQYTVQHTIISLVGPTTTSREAIGSGVDLHLRRPLAMHIRTLRSLFFPSHMCTRLRAALVMSKPSFSKILALFATPQRQIGPRAISPDPDPGNDDMDGVTLGAHLPAISSPTKQKKQHGGDLPDAASIASPLAVRVSRERGVGAGAADAVPVVDDVDLREVLADVRNELGAVKRQLERQTASMKQEREEHVQTLAAVQLEVATAKKDASAAAENLEASVRQLNGAKRQLHQLTEKIEREQQQQAVNNVLREGREGAKSASAEQLQRHVEHLTSELERERRLAVARSIKRGPASTDKQTQAGSGVTSSQFYRTKNSDVGVTCDVMSLAEYGDALQAARVATTSLKALQASLGTDTVDLAQESSQLKRENEELQRQVAAYKAQISEKAGDSMRVNRELTAAKKRIEALEKQQLEAAAVPAPSVTVDEATTKELTALWVEAKLLGASGARAADGAIDHAQYARELARRLASSAGAVGTSTPPLQPRRTSDASSTASSQRQLGPLRGAPRRESGAGKLATKSARPFDDR